jgi:hypothetical protein
MVKLRTEELTDLGKLIAESGYSLNHIIDKALISRNRLVALRTSKKSVLSFAEACRLVAVMKITLEELAEKLKEH